MEKFNYLLIVSYETGIKTYKFFELNTAIEHYKEAKACKLKTTLIDSNGDVIIID